MVQRTIRLAAALAAALVATLAVTASAAAQVRSAVVEDGVDAQPTTPSLEPRPASLEVVRAAASVDTASGTIAVAITLNEPPGSRSLYVDTTFSGAVRCDTGFETDTRTPDASITIDRIAGAPSARARMDGTEGSLSAAAQVSADGLTYSASFSSPLFAGKDWRCFRGSTSFSFPDDKFGTYFTGFERQELTEETSLRFMEGVLAQRLGNEWISVADQGSILCPDERREKVTLSDDGVTASAVCAFRFPVGGRNRTGNARIELQYGYLTLKAFTVGQPFGRALRSCRIRRSLRGPNPQVLSRSLRASAYPGCKDEPGMGVRRLHRAKPGFTSITLPSGINSAFEEFSVYTCKLVARRGGRRTATCENDFGDRVVYRFQLKRKPPKKPRRRASSPGPSRSCDPNYSGCLRVGAGDYDCAGGSGNGPNYVTGPIQIRGSDPHDLDSDGDGVGCE